MSDLENEIERIIASGTLGRSAVYAKLLRYLGATSQQGKLPKEIEIATKVLGKDDFIPNEDSAVRVYVYNLRQKLAAFYAADETASAQQLSIPKGKYELRLKSRSHAPTGKDSRWQTARPVLTAGAVVAMLLVAYLAGRSNPTVVEDVRADLSQAPAWRAILDDDKPIVIAVGDYFVIAEGTPESPGNRLIRDFSINSSDEFDSWIESDPDLARQYSDIRLTYLPVGVASAVADVASVLYPTERSVTVIPVSQLPTSRLRSSHIIYVGYVSGLGDLSQYLFAASKLQPGISYDELIDVDSGESFVSSAGYLTGDSSSYTDYSLMATFPGPADNQVLFITGLRDEGLMQLAASLAKPGDALELGSTLPIATEAQPSFEALFRVGSMDRTNLSSKLLFTSPIDATRVWVK